MSYFRASRKANVYQVQIGHKGQGLPPQATAFLISSGRGGWNHYRTRTFAPRRDFIFCMNRLGGVGAGRSQYKIRGLNHPDGARRCRPYRFEHRHRYRHRHQASYGEILIGDVMEARGGDEDDEKALLEEHTFLNDVISGVAGMITNLLLFNPVDGEVSLHLEPLAAFVDGEFPTQLLGGDQVGHILKDIAGRLRQIAGPDGVISLSDFETVMENSGCPVRGEVMKVMTAMVQDIELDDLPDEVQTPGKDDMLAYFQPQVL